ncbi:MAG: hypothetical protein EOM01_00050 [Spirochaetia bacterium]|nr:hypothetical protein [Spirochaetia bacterium]
MNRYTPLCFLLLVTLLLSGCSSRIDISNAQSQYLNSNYSQAFLDLEQQAPSVLKAQGPIILNYDLGMLARLNKAYKDSNNYLSESERLIREAYTQSITANVASFIVNDNTKAYTGEDYEDIYLNVFKALNYLHQGEEESALVELNRSIEKQAFLKQKYEKQVEQVASYREKQGLGSVEGQSYASSFSTSALANYLSAVVAEGMGEENTRYYAMNQVRHAFASQPALYAFPLPSTAAEDPQKVESGMGRLHVVGFTGQAPLKEERVESIYVSYANRAKIAYPVLVGRPSQVQAIEISVDGNRVQRLERIESIKDIAIDTFRATSELAKLKAVTRAMAKAIGIAAYDAAALEDNQVTAAEELLGWIFRIARDVSESADVRSTHFLPSEAWVGYLDLQPGTYTVELSFLNASGRVLHQEILPNQVVRENGVNLAETFCPY